MKTSELIGLPLDWAVAEARGLNPGPYGAYVPCAGEAHFSEPFHPSTDWSHGGPIIEEEDIMIQPLAQVEGWCAYKVWGDGVDYTGPTPLIAAMRAYVSFKLGDDINIPEGLCT